MIAIFAVKEEGAEPDPNAKPIIDNWELKTINGDGFEIQFNFTDPIMISDGD